MAVKHLLMFIKQGVRGISYVYRTEVCNQTLKGQRLRQDPTIAYDVCDLPGEFAMPNGAVQWIDQGVSQLPKVGRFVQMPL